MSEVVAFSSEQIIAMWARARVLRRAGYACVVGVLLAAVAALALDARVAFGCGAFVLVLGAAAALLVRRARWHERLSVQKLERLGRIPRPERPPSAQELERLIERAKQEP